MVWRCPMLNSALIAHYPDICGWDVSVYEDVERDCCHICAIKKDRLKRDAIVTRRALTATAYSGRDPYIDTIANMVSVPSWKVVFGAMSKEGPLNAQ